MTAKEFFKSTAFKCIVTLLCILLVCGVFLTVAYGFLEVTDSERLQRAINKIYGKEMTVTEIEFDEADATYANATVLAAYEDEDGNYLVQSKGKGGFAGTVTCWVLVVVDDGAITKVGSVTVSGSDGETLLSKINFLDSYADFEYYDGYEYTTEDGFMVSGATLSSGAINNAVNGAVKFVNENCLGNVSEYLYADLIDVDNTTCTEAGGVLTYNIATKSNSPAGAFTLTVVVGTDKKVSSITVVTDGSTAGYGSNLVDVSTFVGLGADELAALIDSSTIKTGATKSSELCLYAALFATANYDLYAGGDSQ